MDQIILDLVNSMDSASFMRLRNETEACARHRNKLLDFRMAPHRREIRCDVEEQAIAIYLQQEDNMDTFEHHAAHELAHAITGCCGFSYKVDLPGAVWEGWEAEQETQEEYALVELRGTIGSFLTHVAVHNVLAEAGYIDRDWDDYLIAEARSKPALEQGPVNRAVNVGWAIQYEQLRCHGLPGFDTSALKQELRRLLPTFDDDYNVVVTGTEIGDLLDVDQCLASTKSLARALAQLVGYRDQDAFTIDFACRPTSEWTLEAVCGRLSQP